MLKLHLLQNIAAKSTQDSDDASAANIAINEETNADINLFIARFYLTSFFNW